MKRTYWIAMGLAAQAASAGVYVEMVDHDIKADKTELAQKMYVQNGLGRFVDGDGRATLIKDGTLCTSSTMRTRATSRSTRRQWTSSRRKISAAMEQMKEQLAKLPPEQRAQMEQMMPGMSGGDQQVDGRSLRHRQVRQGGWTRLPHLGHQAQRRARRSDLRGAVLGAAGQGEFPGDLRELRQGVRGNGEIGPHAGRNDEQRIQRAGEGEWFPGAVARL